MARLIDADALMKEIEKSMNQNPHSDPKVKGCHVHEHNHFMCMVMKQPTAYDVEKVVGELLDKKSHYRTQYLLCKGNLPSLDGCQRGLEDAISIVRKGGVE